MAIQTSDYFSRRGGEPDFTTATYLIIDSVPEMRNALSMTLASFGANKVEFASRLTDAISRIQRTEFDVILSDLSLGHPFDGLYLLEEIKTRNLLKQSAVFMIVTAEARAQNVLSAVEQAPDDYLLKPFTGETLRQRLEKAFYKKQAFRVVDDAVLKHDYLSALTECNRRIDDNDPYMIDFMKLKGRLCLLTGDALEARKTYEEVLRIRPIPWAQMGLGKSLYKQNDYQKAQRVFESIISENQYAMEAYDWLANCMEARQDTLGAQAMLQKAVNLSPAIIGRLRRLGDIAKVNEDWERVAKAYESSIEYGKYSFHHDPLDYAHLSQAQLAQGDDASAEKTLSQVKRAFATPEADLLASTMECQIAIKKHDFARAEKQIQHALEQYQNLADKAPEAVAVELAGACYAAHLPEQGDKIVQQVVKNHDDKPQLMRHVEHMFRAANRQSEGQRLIEANAQDVVEMNNAAVRMAQSGDLEGAVQHFLSVLSERPNNLTVMINATNALLAYVAKNGWHDNYMALAHDYLNHIRTQDPTNGKYQRLMALYRQLQQKFGVR
ncbi:response regulator [Leeia oryzae]|uniref:response regulator n=1 Tax=Leeia oryzae TaxID=356662 RepID=UPI000360E487|nr:response regulator [Leeia oryzae]